jgi:hypothetical protein
MMNSTTPSYSIRPAGVENIRGLSAIEQAAAKLLKGYAPESVLTETTDEHTFGRCRARGAPVGGLEARRARRLRPGKNAS